MGSELITTWQDYESKGWYDSTVRVVPPRRRLLSGRVAPDDPIQVEVRVRSHADVSAPVPARGNTTQRVGTLLDCYM